MLGPVFLLEADADLPWHPAAALFPMLSPKAAAEMEADIGRKGILEPVVVMDGHLLDGRNRHRAAQRLGIQVPVCEYLADDPAGFVLSRNLRRRHLTASQRASVGARLASLPPHRPRKSANLPAYAFSQSAAAGLLQISERSIRLARTVQSDGVADLIDAVDQGRLSVAAAALLATLSRSEQQYLVKAGPAVLKETVQALREARKPPRARSTGNEQWYTPSDVVERARRALGAIDLDPASCIEAQRTVRAKRFYDAQTNGLVQPWSGRVFANPPYTFGVLGQFSDKLVAEYEAGRVTAGILLVLNNSEASWWQRAARSATAICFPKGRIKFIAPDKTAGSPLQGSTIFFFGTAPERFRSAFQDLGVVLPPA